MLVTVLEGESLFVLVTVLEGDSLFVNRGRQISYFSLCSVLDYFRYLAWILKCVIQVCLNFLDPAPPIFSHLFERDFAAIAGI